MQFIELILKHTQIMSVIQSIPEQWWKSSFGSLQTTLSQLHYGNLDILTRHTTAISQEIGRSWLREQTMKALHSVDTVPTLINCTISEERLVTINIPLEFIEWTMFYQVRISPLGEKKFCLRIFYPSDYGSVVWYARLAADLTYKQKLGTELVSVDGELITIKAWNAVCALMVAQGVNSGGEGGILMDMAKDRLI